MDFFGKKCCKCENILHADDDIVICPDCGAPYHRECYAEKGECIFKSKHKLGFEWKPEEVDEQEELTKECKNCGAKNREESMFCHNCGSILSNGFENNNNTGIPPFPGTPNFTIQFDAMGGVPKDEDFGDDINATELAKSVKINTPYYIREFKKIKDNKRSRFNFAAFIFSGTWLLYRKQYLWGTIITVISALLSMFSTYINYSYNTDLFSSIEKTFSASNDYSFLNYFQITVDHINKLNGFELLMFILPYILSFAGIVIMVIIGILGNKMYYKHCKRKISAIKAQYPDNKEKVTEVINETGGVDVKILILLLICQLILNFIPNIL